MTNSREKTIFVLQLGSMLGIWGLFSFIIYWLGSAIYHAWRLQDVPVATIAITCVAMAVFIVLALVLTYVFIGLQLGRDDRTGNAAWPSGGATGP